MKIKYRGKKLGWRIWLKKGAIQIDLRSKSKRKNYPIIQLSAWDTSQNAFISIQQLCINDEYCCAVGKDSFKDHDQIDEDYYFINEKLIHECNNPMTCDAVKRYKKIIS